MKFSDGLCTICKDERENIDHLLIFCKELHLLWRTIENIIVTFLEKDFKLSYKYIISGILERSFEDDLVNLIISVTRYIIWKRRNRAKYENTVMSIQTCIKWIIQELKNHIKTLLGLKRIVRHSKNVEYLEKLFALL